MTDPKEAPATAELVLQLVQEMQDRTDQLSDNIRQVENDLVQLAQQPKRDREVEDRYSLLQESNRELRLAVHSVLKTMGMEPIRLKGDLWVPASSPRNDVFDKSDGNLIEALRVTVHAELREMFNGKTLGRQRITSLVYEVFDKGLRQMVHAAIGYEHGRLRHDSPLAKQLKERLEPLLDTMLDEHEEKIFSSLELPEIPDVMRLWAQDQFRNQLRKRISDLVKKRADELACRVLEDTLDQVVFEEMPWLKNALDKHRAMERLGHTPGTPKAQLPAED